jgi:hypothetical protein
MIAEYEVRDAVAAMRVIHSVHTDWLAALSPEDAELFLTRVGGASFRSFLNAFSDRWLVLGYLDASKTSDGVAELHIIGCVDDKRLLLYAFRAETVAAAGLAIVRREAADFTSMRRLLDQPVRDDLSGFIEPTR